MPRFFCCAAWASARRAPLNSCSRFNALLFLNILSFEQKSVIFLHFVVFMSLFILFFHLFSPQFLCYSPQFSVFSSAPNAGRRMPFFIFAMIPTSVCQSDTNHFLILLFISKHIIVKDIFQRFRYTVYRKKNKHTKPTIPLQERSIPYVAYHCRFCNDYRSDGHCTLINLLF